MAPPIPVYTYKEIQSQHPKWFDDTDNDCELYELVQNQCTLLNTQIICLPFKRIFSRCLDPKGAVRNIEITQPQTNDYRGYNDRYMEMNGEDILKKFLETDEMLRNVFLKQMDECDVLR